MLLILAGIVIWLPSLWGWSSWLLPLRQKQTSQILTFFDLTIGILVGLATLGTIANSVNFFIPVNSTVALFVLLGGWASFLLNLRRFIKLVPRSRLFWVLSTIILIYTAYSAQEPIARYDAGLYYFQSVKWLSESKIPLGLANLHGRLGFNSIWLSIVAVLQVPYLQGTFVINPILLYAYGLSISGAITDFAAGKDIKLSDIFLVLSAIVWLVYANGPYTSSSSPDIPVVFLTLLSLLVLLKALETEKEWLYYSQMAFFIGIFAFIVKASAIPLLLTPFILILGYLYQRRQQPGQFAGLRTAFKIMVVVGLLLIVPWCVRGVLLSGCLDYPIASSCIPGLAWGVPISAVKLEAAWIKSWARQPSIPPDVVLANWQWLGPWLKQLLVSQGDAKYVRTVTVMSASGLGLILIGAAIGNKATAAKIFAKMLFIIIMPLSGLLFWFFSAPDPRFGEAYFWALGMVIFSLGFYKLYTICQLANLNRLILIGGLVAIFFCANKLQPSANSCRDLILKPRLMLLNWPTIPTAEVRSMRTINAELLYAPISGDQCWNAPLLCTPNPDQDLEIILDKDGVPIQFRKTSASSFDKSKIPKPAATERSEAEAQSTYNGLVTIDPKLTNTIKPQETLRTAEWGIEAYADGSLLWLGHGEAEGLHGTLDVVEPQKVQVVFRVEPGPARADRQRTLELTWTHAAGTQTTRQSFDQATNLTFTAELQPGANAFSLVVLEEPTTLVQPDGETRPLLVLLRGVNIKPYYQEGAN